MPTFYDDAPGTDEVKTIYCWVAIDAMGGEGIMAVEVPGIGIAPAMTKDRELAEGPMKRLVRDAAEHVTGRRYELRAFTGYTVLHEFQ